MSSDAIDFDLGLMTCDELEDANFPEKTPLVGNWLKLGESCLLWAETGVGKSLLGMSIALAVAADAPVEIVPGWSTPEEGKRVLYVDGEMDMTDIQSRNQDLKKVLGIKGKTPKLLIKARTNPSKDKDGQQVAFPLIDGSKKSKVVAAWMKIVEDNHVDLVVFDNFNTLTDLEDMSNGAELRNLIDLIVKLRAKGKGVLLVHHANKSGVSYSGSAILAVTFNVIIKLAGRLRQGVELPEDKDEVCHAKFLLTWEKYRGKRDEGVRTMLFSLAESPEFSKRHEGAKWKVGSLSEDDTKTADLMLSGYFTSQTALSKKLGVSKSTVSKRLKRCLDMGYMTLEALSGAERVAGFKHGKNCDEEYQLSRDEVPVADLGKADIAADEPEDAPF